jgi:hypothetical protein
MGGLRDKRKELALGFAYPDAVGEERERHRVRGGRTAEDDDRFAIGTVF